MLAPRFQRTEWQKVSFFRRTVVLKAGCVVATRDGKEYVVVDSGPPLQVIPRGGPRSESLYIPDDAKIKIVGPPEGYE